MGVAILAVTEFLAGKRVLYAAPTQDQLERFWLMVTRALETPIQAGIYYKKETKHLIEKVGSEQRIRAKTAWNADTLRGDYACRISLCGTCTRSSSLRAESCASFKPSRRSFLVFTLRHRHSCWPPASQCLSSARNHTPSRQSSRSRCHPVWFAVHNQIVQRFTRRQHRRKLMPPCLCLILTRHRLVFT